MLITAPASTKLPVDLTFAYATYKRGTAKIVKWLTSTASPAFQCSSPQSPPSPIMRRSCRSPDMATSCNHRSLTVDVLRALADYIVSNSIVVPEEVLFSFHATLEARDCMTCWYQTVAKNQADEEATNGHIVFNAILRGIYKDLSKSGKTPKRPLVSTSQAASCDSGHCSDVDVACSNSFSCLHMEDSNDFGALHDIKRSNTAQTVQESRTRRDAEDHILCNIEDDKLEHLMCLHMYQTEMQQLSDFVKESHLEAGRGNIPLPVVATTTRLAYLASKKVGRTLPDYGVYDPDDLTARLHDHNKAVGCNHAEETEDCSNLIGSLGTIWTTLVEVRCSLLEEDRGLDCPSSKVKSGFQDAYQWFGLEGHANPADATHETASLKVMLAKMMEHLNQLRQCAQPERYTCQRIMADLNDFLYSNSEDPALACHLSFGLHLLLVSYKAYLTGAQERQAPWKSMAVNPRLMSLQTARILKTELKLMLERTDAPCGCLQVNGVSVVQQLNALYKKLENWLMTPRFDLLIQSPWMSGEHMVENLVVSARYGFKAWHHGYYVGLVLHVYNTLVQTGQVRRDEMPVLEHICELFSEEIFLGCRDAAKPYTAYKRWTGGHLKFTGHHRHSSQARRNWDMCVKADPSKGGDKVCRAFTPGKISLFALVTENKDVVDLDVLERVIARTAESPSTTIKRDAARLQDDLLASGGFATYLRTVQRVLHDEFRPRSCTTSGTSTTPRKSPLPVGLINPFLVYRSCLGVLGIISDSTHPPKEAGTLCRCVCERTLAASEVWMTANKATTSTGKRTLYPDRDAAGICKRELLKVFGKMGVEDVLWKL